MKKNQVLDCLVNGIKGGEKYPVAVREFSFSISYHSPAAYNVIREKFNNHLPHPKTIKAWLALSDLTGNPGLTEETMDRLKRFVQDLKGIFQKGLQKPRSHFEKMTACMENATDAIF